ncbi:MAG: DUF3160 domain-containing protein, partial [Acidobacteria bacterium]|nr:DUF3160 domain-containing protein [Acidobacteriota bacterium]
LLMGASIFDAPELSVAPSPAQPRQFRLPDGARVLDSDVSPAGPIVALLVGLSSGGREVLLWNLDQSPPLKIWDVPAGLAARSLAWHPQATALFVSGAQGAQWVIVKVESKAGAWQGRPIYHSALEIRRLVPGPRPFLIPDRTGRQNVQAYRLFFGVKAADGRYSIHSITEEGQRDYQVIGRKEGFTRLPNSGEPPSTITASSALPAAFHPAGHLLLWENEAHCFQSAAYGRDHWESSTKLYGRELCGGTVSVTPNGTGILHWEPGSDGVELLLEHGAVTRREAAGHRLAAAPSSVPDGRGIVAVTRSTVDYVPIQVPLADTANAWMYLESAQDTGLFTRHGGLFRDLKDLDQLYSLYDSESYECGAFDQSTPTRPYLVTTDSFWELFAAAYEGMFIVRERQIAMPAFRQFVAKAHASLSQTAPQSRWTRVFAALQATATANEEAARILRATGRIHSTTLDTEFDYGELKPRGHYTATPAAQAYFRAFRYLTRVSALNWSTDELRRLSPEAQAAARRWVGAYVDLIAPSRSPLLWQETAFTPPAYVKHPQTWPRLFPLSWGFDNEALYSTVYHAGLPAAETIDGASGQRIIPSGLDVAAALGSRFARTLLAAEIAKFPKLTVALDALNARMGSRRLNLYERWLETLGEQWADATPSPNGDLDAMLWRTKRLQTGLASWATLRHATVLVNERTSAECGEGGFEAIVMRPPRGYVEPDPRTFGRIGELFDAVSALVRSTGALEQGLLRRLGETAAKARLFQSIAQKELRAEP